MDKMAFTNKKKQLIFRCNHRGTKEMDLLLGSFAKKYVPDFDENQLQQFEELITNSDPDIYNWMTKKEKIPQEWQNEISAKLIGFELNNS